MKVTVIKGALRTLGDALISTDKFGSITNYSYIETENGEIFRNVRVASGLNGKLQSVLNDAYTEIHLILGKEKAAVVAIKDASNRVYAMDTKVGWANGNIPPLFFLIWGIMLFLVGISERNGVGYFIFGSILLLFAYSFWSSSKNVNELKKYIDSLPSVIKI